MPCGAQAEHAHLAELERDAARGAEVAAVLREDRAHRGDRARRVVRGRFDDHGHAVRRVALVDDLVVVRRVLADRALDRGLDLVLRHVDVARVLQDAAQRGIRARVGAAGFHGDDDFLVDARELLGHAVPAREHRVLADFEDSSHRARIFARGGRGVSPRPSARATGGRAASACLEQGSAWRLSPITRSKSSPSVASTGSATGFTCFAT